MKLLSSRVAPSEALEVVASVVTAVVGPERAREMQLPSDHFVRGLRAEMGVLHETLVALDLGDGELVDAATDASPLDGKELATTQVSVERDGVTRSWTTGAIQLRDQTAAGEAKAIADRFKDMNRAIELLRGVIEKRLGADTAAKALPAAGSAGVQNLAGRAVATDNASTAIASVRELRTHVEKALREELGVEQWELLPPSERANLAKVYHANCHRHLGKSSTFVAMPPGRPCACSGNTFLDGGAKAEAKLLDDLLNDSLANGDAKRLRLTASLNKIIHAASKGFGEGVDRYGQGFGHKVRAFLVAKHGGDLYLTLGRTDKGTRQDACTEAAWVLYFNHPLLIEYLNDTTYAPQNILRDNLFSTLTSKEIIGTLRARAIINDKFTKPCCFFAASNDLDDWSVLNMASIHEQSRTFFQTCRDNPHLVATAEYEVFDVSIEPYAKFLERRAASTRLSVDGRTKISDVAAVRTRLYDVRPDAADDPEIKTMHKVIEAWGRGSLHTFENGEAMRYVDDGDLAAANQTSDVQQAYKGSRRNTNRVEGEFGSLKFYAGMYFNMHVESLAGVVSCQLDNVFGRSADTHGVKRRKRVADDAASRTTTKARARASRGAGPLDDLGADVRLAALEAARRGCADYKARADARREAAIDHHQARDAEAVEKALERQIADYNKAIAAIAYAPLVDEAALAPGNKTKISAVNKRLDTVLRQLPSDSVRAKKLKENIERYCVGMGMEGLKPKSYSSAQDETIGKLGSAENVASLTRQLKGIYDVIKSERRELSTEAVVPGARRRRLPVVGTATTHAACRPRVSAARERRRARAPRRGAMLVEETGAATDSSLATADDRRHVGWYAGRGPLGVGRPARRLLDARRH